MGSPHISCLRAVATGTRWLWGALSPTLAVLARELPATPHLQGETPWDVETKGQGFLEPIFPMWFTTPVPVQSAPSLSFSGSP